MYKNKIMDNNQNNKVEQLSKLLKEHDWYYNQSDDSRIWEEGQKKHDEIIKLREEINLSHNGLGNVLYKQASPFEK